MRRLSAIAVAMFVGCALIAAGCGGGVVPSSTAAGSEDTSVSPAATSAPEESSYYPTAKATLEEVCADSEVLFDAQTSDEMGAAVEGFQASVKAALSKWRGLDVPAQFEASHALGLAALEAYDEGLSLLSQATLAGDDAGLDESQTLLTQAEEYYTQWQTQSAKEAQ